MVEYCENTDTCRHVFLMKYFDTLDQSFKPNLDALCPNKNCDICKCPKTVKKLYWNHSNNIPCTSPMKESNKRSLDDANCIYRTKFTGFQKASELKTIQPVAKHTNLTRTLLKGKSLNDKKQKSSKPDKLFFQARQK